MRITAVHVQNFKRVRDVVIKPDADRQLVLIGGKNAAGKSSVLDALTAAFGGKRAQPVDPVRHGSESATISVELDGGELTVRRIIDKSGESVLEVRDREGAVKAPQTILDRLVSGRFLDPLAFLSLPAKEQRATLMKLIDGADRIVELNGKRERAFTRRTEIGRDLTKAEGELARLPELPVGEAIDVVSLTAEVRGLDAHRRGVDTARAQFEQCERETDQAKAKVAAIAAELTRLRAQIAQLELDAAAWATDVVTCEATEAAAKANYDDAAARAEAAEPRRAAIAHEIAKAQDHNKTIAAAEAQNARRTDAAAEVAKLTKEREDLTKVIETIDARKAEILAAAKLPVPELGISDTGIELGGVPFAQASGAERLRSLSRWRSLRRPG
jgi:DNA repair exonuclease SbcCD ATPase subunit